MNWQSLHVDLDMPVSVDGFPSSFSNDLLSWCASLDHTPQGGLGHGVSYASPTEPTECITPALPTAPAKTIAGWQIDAADIP